MSDLSDWAEDKQVSWNLHRESVLAARKAEDGLIAHVSRHVRPKEVYET